MKNIDPDAIARNPYATEAELAAMTQEYGRQEGAADRAAGKPCADVRADLDGADYVNGYLRGYNA